MSDNWTRGFLAQLFKPGETINFAQSTLDKRPTNEGLWTMPPSPQVTTHSGVGDPAFDGLTYFSINPVQGRRLSANVSAHRNFLIECDDLALDKQRNYIDGLGVPWSTCVYSGGKSYHFVIALTHSVTPKEYAELARHIFAAVPAADPSTKDPSRLSRLAGAVRPDTDEVQELIEMRDPITLQELQRWLSNFPVPKKPRMSKVFDTTTREWRKVESMTNTTRQLLMFGVGPKGNRHYSLIHAGINMCGMGWPIKTAIEKITMATDFKGIARDLDPADIERLLIEGYQCKLRREGLI